MRTLLLVLISFFPMMVVAEDEVVRLDYRDHLQAVMERVTANNPIAASLCYTPVECDTSLARLSEIKTVCPHAHVFLIEVRQCQFVTNLAGFLNNGPCQNKVDRILDGRSANLTIGWVKKSDPLTIESDYAASTAEGGLQQWCSKYFVAHEGGP